MLLAQLLKIWPRFLSVTIYFYHICFMPRLGRYSTMLTHSPAIKPPSYLWFLLATWLWFTVLPPPASSLLLLSFSSSLPGAFWTYTPTFLLHCPITDSSLYWLVKMGRRFTLDHLSTGGLSNHSWGSRVKVRIQTALRQPTTHCNAKVKNLLYQVCRNNSYHLFSALTIKADPSGWAEERIGQDF